MILMNMLLATWLFGIALSQVGDDKRWTVETFPNPMEQPYKRCGIERKSTICDPDNTPLLSEDERAHVQAALEVFYEQEVGCGKAEMGVAIMGFMEKNTTAYAKTMACGLLDAWGVGKKECNNGVMLALSVFDRKLHFCTGAGARKLLPDDELEKIINSMKPLLKKAHYGAAIEQSISQLASVINGHSYVEEEKLADFYSMCFSGVFISFFGAIMCWSYWGERQKNNRYRRCQQQLTRIEQESADTLAQKFNTFEGSCPICLEDFSAESNETTNESNGAPEARPLNPAEGSSVAPVGSTVLRCGHGFHQKCLDGWEARGTGQCPVCRCTADGSEPGAGAEPVMSALSSSSSPGLMRRGINSVDSTSLFRRDRMFRMRRLQHFYPEYIDDTMLTRATHNSALVLSQDSVFVQRSPEYQRSLRQAQIGRSATGMGGFGGGSSGGGGGGGGGW
eukprot:GEMP01027334.1.p1 GENE.GEMP01027334.1~~GEMP01027334.1.p1  ORF type:complete len:450 (+),score=96.48 GEMP01027334.1:86-1435(+)